jgi:hypothetical protein
MIGDPIIIQLWGAKDEVVSGIVSGIYYHPGRVIKSTDISPFLEGQPCRSIPVVETFAGGRIRVINQQTFSGVVHRMGTRVQLYDIHFGDQQTFDCGFEV